MNKASFYSHFQLLDLRLSKWHPACPVDRESLLDSFADNGDVMEMGSTTKRDVMANHIRIEFARYQQTLWLA
jgi:hypothetical protein